MTAVIVITCLVGCWAAGYGFRWIQDIMREDRALAEADRGLPELLRETEMAPHYNAATVPEGHRVGDYCPRCEWCDACWVPGHLATDHAELEDPGEIVKLGRGRVVETWEGVPAALSGPYDPDIDVAQPFGDPPDDDGPDTPSEPLRPLPDPEPASEAELAWAYDHLVRDREHPAYYMPENRHAMRILGWTDAAHDAELAAQDWDAMLAEARR